MSGGRKLNSARRRDFLDGSMARVVYHGHPVHVGGFGCYPILNHTVFKYAGSARLMGKSGGCGT